MLGNKLRANSGVSEPSSKLQAILQQPELFGFASPKGPMVNVMSVSAIHIRDTSELGTARVCISGCVIAQPGDSALGKGMLHKKKTGMVRRGVVGLGHLSLVLKLINFKSVILNLP